MDFRQLEKYSTNPNLLRFAKYCEGLAGDKSMPHRQDFLPGNIHWLYGCFYAVEVMEGGRDYRCTFDSTLFGALYGFDLLGKRISELEACGRLSVQRRDFDAVTAAGAPRYRTGRLVWPDRKSIRNERIIVPFAGDDGNAALLVVAAQCDKPFQELRGYKGIGEPHLELDELDAMAA